MLEIVSDEAACKLDKCFFASVQLADGKQIEGNARDVYRLEIIYSFLSVLLEGAINNNHIHLVRRLIIAVGKPESSL